MSDPPARLALESQVLDALRRLFEAARARYRDVERRSGMPAAPLRALAEIVRRPNASSAQLAQALGVRPATASNLLKLLEAEGLVEKQRESRDQRVVRIRATRKGARLVDATGAGGVLSVAIAALEAGELEALARSLQLLTAKVPAAPGPAPSLAFRAAGLRRKAPREQPG